MASQHSDKRDGAQRILEAAVLLFGERGVRGTPMKAIAAEAGVSQALIVHHYGTKERLRLACDDYVADTIRNHKEQTIVDDPQLDPLIALRHLEHGRPLLRYLIRTMTEGGSHATHLIDGMIADAGEYMAQGERDGLIKASAVPHDRAVLLVIWSLGALALHEHVERLLGVDFLAENAPPEEFQRYLRPAMEIFTQGVLEDGAFERLSGFLADPTVKPQTDTEHNDEK